MMTESNNRFVPGQPYFIVMFQDENMSVPVVQTLIYERTSVRESGEKCFLFLEIPIDGPESTIFVDEEHADHLVLDKEALLNKLEKCLGLKPEVRLGR